MHGPVNKYLEHLKAAMEEDDQKCVEKMKPASLRDLARELAKVAAIDKQYDRDEASLLCPACLQVFLEYAEMMTHMSARHPASLSMFLG